MAVWPVTLPVSPLMNSYREKKPETVVRTQMDQGPAKVRRRTTAGVAQLETLWLLDATQMAALDDFFETTIEGGVGAFDLTHPRTGDTVSCRMTSPPEYRVANGAYYYATIMLEVLP